MGIYEDLLKRKKIIEDEQGNVTVNSVVDKNIRSQLTNNNIQTYNRENTNNAINQMKNILTKTAGNTIWEQMQNIITNKPANTSNIVNGFFNNLNRSIEDEKSPTTKNKNIIEDTKGLAKLIGFGAVTGSKNAINYIEKANENNFKEYEKLKKNQFITSTNISEEDKAKAKIQNNLLLNSKGIKVNEEDKTETNLVKKAIKESIYKDNQKIQEEQAKMSNAVTGKLGEIAPSMGQMIPGTVFSAVNPYLGTAYFTTSSGGSYIDDALNRGMNEEQAFKYGTVMGVLEGVSETAITGQQLNKVSKAFTGKEISKKILESYGFNIFENAVQEAVMEPAQEITAGIIGDKADWSNMGSRMLESGFNGALMGAISNGVTFGLEKSGNVYNKVKNGEIITETEYREALQENIDKFGKEAVENAMKNGATEVYQEINNLQQQSTQNEQNIPTQQITQEQNKVAQNGNMEQMTNQQKIDEIAKNKPSFSKQIDQYVAKKYPSGDFLFLGKTPDVLTKLGAPDNQIILKQNKLKSLIEQSNDDTSKLHGVPIETIKRLPEAIANPLNILKSSTDENSIVIITDLADTKERPIIASIELNYDGQIGNIDFLSNRLTSAYGKNNYDRFMQTEIAKGNLLYDIDEGIIKELPTTRLQSSKGISSFDETSSFINNSISQIDTKVNENTITNNYAQSNENNTQNEVNLPMQEKTNLPTKGETIDWNEIERPEGKIRRHYRSIIESSNTTAQAKAIAKEMMGTDTYVPESNQKHISEADSIIQLQGVDKALTTLSGNVLNGNKRITAVDIATGERLIEYYSKIGDAKKLQEAIHTTALAGTQAGRTVQALAILNHMTPSGQLVWIDRSIEKANNELRKKYHKKKDIPQFEVTQEMKEKIKSTKTKEEMFKAIDEVYEELGQQVPKSISEKIDEWRYFSMLANLKTHGRNIIGNVAMHYTQRAKDKVAGAIEGVVSKFNPEMERTHTIRKVNEEVKQFAKNDVENRDVQTLLGMNEDKYNPQSRLQKSRKTFKNDFLNNTLGKAFKGNSNLLEVEDNLFLKPMYKKALGEYIMANKIDINNITNAQLDKARKYAVQQAKEATFHQESALASALNQMGRKHNITKFALDAIVPFKKTPINVAKTGARYSPVGLIYSSIYDTVQLRKGNITVNQYIDNISKGLTGTGIAFMGFALTEAGILKASGSDNDKKEKYEEEQGKQSYSIEIAGKTYSLDWLSPVGIPLFIGSEFNQLLHKDQKEKNSKSNDEDEFFNQAINGLSNIMNASANSMNPMTEMSMISGLTSTLSSYNKDNAIGDMIVNSGESYVNQFIPTALSQLARTTDEYERTTKSTKTGTVEKAVDSTINRFKSKIPVLRQTLPTKTDIWGKDIKQSANLPFRAFNNFINPSTIKDVSKDKVDKELNSLYARTGESSIIPKAIEKTYTIDGTTYRMTDNEYAKYYKKYGETSYELINGLINSKDYKDLTNEQKQKAIENVYSYAKESNKLDYANNNNLEVDKSTLYKTMESLKNNEGNCSNYLVYIGKTQGITGKGASKKKIGILADSDYSDITKKLIYENTEGNEDKKLKLVEKLKLPITEYLRYKSNKFENDKDEDNETISGTKKQKVVSYLQSISDRKLPIEYKKIIAKIEGINDFNSDIVNYINNKNNLTQSDKKELLEIIGFKVTKEGNVQNTTILPITKNVK